MPLGRIRLVEALTRSHDLSYDQERRVLLEEWTVLQSVPFVQPHLVLGVPLAAAIRPSAIDDTLKEIITRHAALRRTFAATGQIQTFERHKRVGDAALSRVSVSGLHRSQVSGSVSAETNELARWGPSGADELGGLGDVIWAEGSRPFDTATGPLVRASILRADRGDGQLLLISADRLVADWDTVAKIASLLACKGAMARFAGAAFPAPKTSVTPLASATLHWRE